MAKSKDFKITLNPNVPIDQKMNELLKEAYFKDLLCYKAVIKLNAIRPFSNYVPEITRGSLDEFEQEEKNGELHYLFVYQEGNKFIMSDDYSKYYCYKLLGINEVPCVVLGEPSGENVLYKDKPFLLEPPKIKIVEK